MKTQPETQPQSTPPALDVASVAPIPQSEIRIPQCKINLPPEFEDLTPEQLEYINDYLPDHSYPDAQNMLLVELGIRISINKLFRYYKKLELARELEIAEDSHEAVEQLLNLFNGQPVDLDKAGLETVKRRALDLAISPKTKPSMLLNLMRIFTWEHRRNMDVEKSSHRNRMATLAERRAKCEEDRVKILDRRQSHLENKGKTLSTEEMSDAIRLILGPVRGPKSATTPESIGPKPTDTANDITQPSPEHS